MFSLLLKDLISDFIFGLSHLRQQYWCPLFRGVLPEKAMAFMYPCTCILFSVYYFILQTSSSTYLYLSRRTKRDEWIPHCLYSRLVGPWGEIRVASLMVTSTSLTDEIIWGTNKEIGIIPVVMEDVGHQVISLSVCVHERNDDCSIWWT